MTVVLPDRVGEDVGGIHRLPSIDGGAAGCALRGNRHWPYLGRKVWKTGCRGAAEIFPVLVRKPDRAEHAIALGFDQPGDDRQNLRQRRSRENQVQNAEYGLGVHGDSRCRDPHSSSVLLKLSAPLTSQPSAILRRICPGCIRLSFREMLNRRARFPRTPPSAHGFQQRREASKSFPLRTARCSVPPQPCP